MSPASRVYWYEQRPRRPALPPLSTDISTEVVVIGGGVAGLACAQALNAQGHKVVLLEKESCGSGASGRSSGFITPDSEMELSSLIRTRGPERARRLWEFVVSGVDDIRRNIEQRHIDCDYRIQDSLFLANSPGAVTLVRHEHDARTRVGYDSTLYDSETIRSILGSKECCGAVRYSGTFGINAWSYCQAMRDVLRDAGVTICENSRVTAVDGGRVTANSVTVRGDAVVLCVDRSLPDFAVLSSEVFRIQTFLAASAPLTDAQVTTIFPERPLMVWDTDLIYQYFRMTGDNRLLIGASSPLYTYARNVHSIVPRIVRKMRAFVQRKFPGMPIELEYFWPGLIGVSKDLLPLCGRLRSQPTVSFVSGATGLAWAAALGRYVADTLVSSRADYDAEFDPGRHFTVGPMLQHLIGKPAAFAVSHGVVKLRR